MLRRQAGRCMDCGIPFCHQGCPLGNLIPEWNDLIWRGEGRAGDRAPARDEQLPGVHRAALPGAVRDRVRAGHQPARGDDQAGRGRRSSTRPSRTAGCSPQPPERLTGKTVAVVGSGPAGLAAAQQLTRAGHTVAVFERDDRIGGLLRYGIPDFKMEKQHLELRLAPDAGRGHALPRRASRSAWTSRWSDLRARYDAVVIATGATVPRDLPIPGRDLAGVHFAMEYLVAVEPRRRRRLGRRTRSRRRASTSSSSAAATPAPTASAPRTARARSASPTSRSARSRRGERPGAPALADASDPVRGLQRARGGRRAGLPRIHRRVPRRTRRARCARIRVAETEYVDGRRVPKSRHRARDPRGPRAPRARASPAPRARTRLEEPARAPFAERGNVARDDDYQTTAAGVFVAGDAGRGQSLIVWAIAEGRAAASARRPVP